MEDKNSLNYKLRRLIYQAAVKVVGKGKVKFEDVVLEHPLRQAQGDYSTNIALKFKIQNSKLKILNQYDLANAIVNAWRSQGLPAYVGKIGVVQPGFINIWLQNEYLISQVWEVLKEKERYGSSKVGKGKTVVIDYSSPNIAKPFGVGHLRSTIIGQAIYNIYKFLGWKTVGVNHLGDWGTQFGKLIVAIRRWAKKPADQLTVSDLEKLYVKFHQQAEKNPALEDEARAWFKKLEEGEAEAKKIWKACVEISLREFERVYQLLGVKIDFALGESFYEDKMREIIKLALRKKIAKKGQGALIVDLSEAGLPPAMLLKSDGATTYELRDLAAIWYRKRRWQPDLYVYEVGADQKLHFQQTFLVAEKLGMGKLTHFVHVPHGLIQFDGGKMSTRAGKTVHLEEILQEAISRAQKIIQASQTGRGLTPRQQVEVARAVGVGAVKYFDLSHHPTTDIVFEWEKMFRLEGNSAPYLQYTYARTQSVLKKSKSFTIRDRNRYDEPVNEEEKSILRTIYKFPEVVLEAGENFAPNLICNYLFELAGKYNLFYNKWPILKAPSPELVEGRLALTAATGQILKNGLTLLGIETPRKM
ncbi:MAG: arginine--tRNA ligase [Microgenomates group bacterium]